jgi:hypothetical protein
MNYINNNNSNNNNKTNIFKNLEQISFNSIEITGFVGENFITKGVDKNGNNYLKFYLYHTKKSNNFSIRINI